VSCPSKTRCLLEAAIRAKQDRESKPSRGSRHFHGTEAPLFPLFSPPSLSLSLFCSRDFRFRSAARASAPEGHEERKGKRRGRQGEEARQESGRHPGRPSHPPRICRATDSSIRCITCPPVREETAPRTLADESLWIAVYRLFHSWNADRSVVRASSRIGVRVSREHEHVRREGGREGGRESRATAEVLPNYR